MRTLLAILGAGAVVLYFATPNAKRKTTWDVIMGQPLVKPSTQVGVYGIDWGDRQDPYHDVTGDDVVFKDA